MVSKETPTPLLTVQVLFEEKLESVSDATIYISILDVTMADAPSKVILQQVVKDIDYKANNNKSYQEFRIYGQIPNNKASTPLEVHVDVDNDGKISVGDYINMESYPVLTYGNPNYISVKVKNVK